MAGFHGSAAFVGRSSELSALRELWAAATLGRSRLVVIGGEAGIGKSRLVTEFASGLAPGARIVVGNCPPVAPGLVPFAPVAEILRELGPASAAGLAPAQAGAIARLLDVELPVGRAGTPDEAERSRLLGAVRAVLEGAGRDGPLLVVFEDLHWADESTRELLAYLGSQPLRAPVMIVGTYRNDEPHGARRVWALVDLLTRLGGRRLDLERLAQTELEGLLGGLMGRQPDALVVAAVMARSEGNPFLAEELAAANAVSGQLPEGLRNLLLARVLDLPDPARLALGIAAVAGASVDHDLLADAWRTGAGDGALDPAMRQAVQAGVLRGVAVQRRYAFRHALVREAVYDDLLPADRAHWHRVLAECLERAGSGLATGYAARAALIAHHWLAAGDRARALAASVDAAKAAEQMSAFGEAGSHYRVAIELWQELGTSPAGRWSLTPSQLFEDAARVSYLSGDPLSAVKDAARAIDLADSESEPTRVGLLHERRARYRWSAGFPYADSADDCRIAVELVPDEPTPARARVLAALGQNLMLGHRFGESIAVTERALELARTAAAPPELIAHALSTLGTARAYRGDVTEGIELAEESVRIAGQGATTENLFRAYANLACILLLTDPARAAEVALEGAGIAARAGLAMTYGNFLTGNAVSALLSTGKFGPAAELLAGAVIGPATAPVASANLLVSSVVLAAWQGDLATVDRDLAQIDTWLARGGHADMRSRLAVAAAEAATWSGAFLPACRYLLIAADVDADTDDLDMRPHVAAIGLRLAAEWPAAAQGWEPERQALIRRMRKTAADPRLGRAPWPQARAHLLTAQAEATRLAGPPDPARWGAAIAAWELVPAPHRTAYARLRLAEALLAHAGQRGQARHQLAAAREAAERLDARALAAAADHLSARAGLPAATPGPPDPAAHFGLTQREREVLGLICAGRTNRQIAAELFISPKTAGLHVSHILAKLGVATRGEAAALAYRLEAGRAPQIEIGMR